jgi:hypothetical protein
MDVLYFLRKRSNFIRRFYEAAGEPFRETIRKIELGEAPFDDPPYSEEGEPPFMEEWSEASTALEILGRNCVSMLSASLQLYFKTWESQLGITWEPGERKGVFKNGFVQGYRTCFGETLKLSWHDCPVNFDILEQIILARNRDQHPDGIATLHVAHDRPAREKHPNLLFVSESEKEMFGDPACWMSPTVHISRDALAAAIDQVETLGEWLEERMSAAMHPKAHLRE